MLCSNTEVKIPRTMSQKPKESCASSNKTGSYQPDISRSLKLDYLVQAQSITNFDKKTFQKSLWNRSTILVKQQKSQEKTESQAQKTAFDLENEKVTHKCIARGNSGWEIRWHEIQSLKGGN